MPYCNNISILLRTIINNIAQIKGMKLGLKENDWIRNAFVCRMRKRIGTAIGFKVLYDLVWVK
jgi:hypothetical protein